MSNRDWESCLEVKWEIDMEKVTETFSQAKAAREEMHCGKDVLLRVGLE